jgi:hypothetical protein
MQTKTKSQNPRITTSPKTNEISKNFMSKENFSKTSTNKIQNFIKSHTVKSSYTTKTSHPPLKPKPSHT